MLVRLTMLLTALLFVVTSVQAGEMLRLQELVNRSDAVAEVTVELSTSRTPDKITRVKWLTAEPRENFSSQEWITGQCLPTREIITDNWLARLPHFSSASLWRAALDKGRYSAVIFLKKDKEQLRPTCEAEALLVENWESHPDHARWFSKLCALIGRSEHLQPGAQCH